MTLAMSARLHAVLFATLLLLLVQPWPSCRLHSASKQWPSLLVAGQGLAITNEQLGAGEIATADEFANWEDALELSSQSTGGRGTGGKGGTRTGASFKTADKMEQLQLSMYYIAGSPKVYNSWNTSDTGGVNLVPRARDQGECWTCVTQAVAAAIQMSVAAALLRSPQFKNSKLSDWQVSPQSLYYCSKGGRTCKTGWEIQEALNFVIDEAPELMRPTRCIDKEGKLNNTAVEPGVNTWQPLCQDAASTCSKTFTVSVGKPWLRCTYKSLSSFWQIQEHIRNHGAVISRLTVYDDFNIQINASAKFKTGAEWPPYKLNITAKPLFGHAAVIVGYDNINNTWTLLNSYGDGSSTTRFKGVTKDGMFRINMGVAGVGVPDQTYGVECVPAPGTAADPHETQPWRQPKPVSLVTRNDLYNLNASCYHYKATSSDTVASIADAFGLDMRAFVQDNAALFGPLQNVTYKFGVKLSADEISEILTVVQNATAKSPVMKCFYYDAAGKESSVACDRLTGTAACAVNGVVGCTLQYYDVNVVQQLVPSTVVRICNISKPEQPGEFEKVARFISPSVSQPRALFGILRAIDPNASAAQMSDYAKCSVVTTVPLSDQVEVRWKVYCMGNNVVSLEFQVQVSNNVDLVKWQPTFDDRLLYPLLNLQQLQQLILLVYDGQLPPQLGSLKKLSAVIVQHYCMGGTLPPNLFKGWKQISRLTVKQYEDAVGLVPEGSTCGLLGQIPTEWFSTRLDSLYTLDLSNNRLSGYLPPSLLKWRSIAELWLQNNALVGPIPAGWSKQGVQNGLHLGDVDLSGNKLEGVFPLSWADLDLNGGKGLLTTLRLDNNAGLKGCIPLSSMLTLTFAGTQLTGLCKSDVLEMEERQYRALNTTLGKLLLPFVSDGYKVMLSSLVQAAYPLGQVVQVGQTARTLYKENPSSAALGSASLTVSLIDGTAYVTAIKAVYASFNASHMADLFRDLPRLESFYCDNCNKIPEGQSKRSDHLLSGELPKLAPYLKELRIPHSNLTGPLPSAWGSWSSLQYVELDWNDITGSLPDSFFGLRSLMFIDLSRNKLRGGLPAAWGSARTIPNNVEMLFSLNPNITGGIPSSWAWFSSAKVVVSGTNITGCAPDSLTVITNEYSAVYETAPPCSSQGDPEVTALLSLRALLLSLSTQNAAGLASWAGEPGGGGPNTPPNYCRSWQGVSCDTSNHITSLKLSAMELSVKSLSMSQLVSTIKGMKYLQTLDVSELGLTGSLSEDLVSFAYLQSMIVNGNPQINGTLPDIYSGLAALKVLDVSGCAVTGALPDAYAALQQLQVFKAANTQLSGVLPPSWGLLKSLAELDVSNAKLTGQLPTEWIDPFAVQSVAVASFAAAEARANEFAVKQTVEQATTAAAAWNEQLTVAAAAARRAMESLQPLVGSVAVATATVDNTSDADLFLKKLQVLRLANNQLSGTLHAGLAKLPSLRLLDLSVTAGGGQLSGQLPSQFALMEQLQELLLSGHNLSGSLPLQWSTLTSLLHIDLSSNALSGQLPSSWNGMANLQKLILGQNQFSGSLPPMWFSLRFLEHLDVSHNMLTGVVPSVWGRMADSSSYSLKQQGILLTKNCMEGKDLAASVASAGLQAYVVFDADGSSTPCPPL